MCKDNHVNIRMFQMCESIDDTCESILTGDWASSITHQSLEQCLNFNLDTNQKNCGCTQGCTSQSHSA